MANNLDLQDQEQLDQFKHFWKQYGDMILWILIAVFGSIAAYNGWQYYQRNQSLAAATIYDELERAATAGDVTRVERALADIKDKFGSTTYAAQAGLLAGKVLFEKGKPDAAKASLEGVVSGGGDDALKAIARIRLAGVLIEQKNYADAAKVLDATFPAEFVGLAADRRGDLAVSQGKPDEARAQYGAAYKAMDERTDYRRMVEVKLNALGVDPTPPAVIAPASAAALAAVPKVAPPAAAASAVASAPAVAPASGVSK